MNQNSSAGSSSIWNPSSRSVAPLLPSAFTSSLESREITTADYEVLLQLDQPSAPQGSIPLHVVNSFPTVKLSYSHELLRKKHDVDVEEFGRPRDKQKSICYVCMNVFVIDQCVRRIPCGHYFHRECIDRWLLTQRSNCPMCGLAAYTVISDDESTTENNLTHKNKKLFQPANYGILDLHEGSESMHASEDTRKRVKRKKKKPALSEDTHPVNYMMIVGKNHNPHCRSAVVPMNCNENRLNSPSFSTEQLYPEGQTQLKSKSRSNKMKPIIPKSHIPSSSSISNHGPSAIEFNTLGTSI